MSDNKNGGNRANLLILLSFLAFVAVNAISYKFFSSDSVVWFENFVPSEESVTIISGTATPTTSTAKATGTVSATKTTETVSALKKTSTTRVSGDLEQKTSETATAVEVFEDELPLYIDINTADREELKLLDGIGDVRADAIIEYREANGGFKNIDEIKNVKGIGDGIFSEIADFIYVENPVYPENSENSEEIQEDYDNRDSEISENSEVPETSENDVSEKSVSEEEEEVTEYVPTLEDVAPINLNTADAELLLLLPYVDEEIADEILNLREEIGGFGNSYELLYLKSLTQEQVAEIVNYVTVGD